MNQLKYTNIHPKAAVLQREIASRLLERLELIRIAPSVILDLGAGQGFMSALLQARYPAAELMLLDHDWDLLQYSQSELKDQTKVQAVCTHTLPIETNSVDLVVSNLYLPIIENWQTYLTEIYRVLKPEGLVLFTLLGPDSLQELRYSVAQANLQSSVKTFVDMHHVGDFLLEKGFLNPVMDMEYLHFSYEDMDALMQDLIEAEIIDQNMGMDKKLMDQYETLRDEYGLPLTYEIMYGHAWMNDNKNNFMTGLDEQGEAVVPIANIKRREKDGQNK